jgi:hypothetical protein
VTTDDAPTLPACASPYAQANCRTYQVGTVVASARHSWKCRDGNCRNCDSIASCAPGGQGCPWGDVWTDEGPCE